MLKTKKIILIFLFSLLFVSEIKAEKITIGALRFTSHAPSFVAYERGYFKDNGLEVEFKFFKSAQPMAIAIASGDVDFGITALSGGLVNLAGKGAIKVIAGALHEEEGIDGNMILASKKAIDAGLKTPKDLKGKTFAITQSGSSFQYVAYKIAQKEGFASSDIKIKALQRVGTIIGALKTQQIDAWSIVPHIAKSLDKSPNISIIGRVSDYIPNYQVTTVFTSSFNAKNKRDLVNSFLRAFKKGIADYNAALIDKTLGEEGLNSMVKLIHKYVYASKAYKKASVSIINGSMRINEGAKLDLTSIKDQLKWLQDTKLVKKNITIDMIVDKSYVQTY